MACRDLAQGRLTKQENECIALSVQEFSGLVCVCRREWGRVWSKEYREMDDEKLVRSVTDYMKKWLLLRLKNI